LKEKYRIILEVGKYFLKNGPIIIAKHLGTVYNTHKENILNNLNLLNYWQFFYRIHLHETTFFVEKRENLYAVVKKLEDASRAEIKKEMNSHIKNVIGDLFNTALRFVDTKKDQDLIKGLFATATSTNFVAKL
jgi:hypothetical protein